MKNIVGQSWKLGMFVLLAIVAFAITIYFIGKNKNIFGSTFTIKTIFKTVSGLKEGNNIRFSGINVGTINSIQLLTDTSVMVELVIKKEVQKFIKKDAKASIGSDGLMGDKVLTISPSTTTSATIADGDFILSKSPIEMEDVMTSVKSSVDNAGIITAQLAQFSYKMNNGNGALSKLISDEEFSGSLKKTLTNLQSSTDEFAKFTVKMNSGKGALSKMMTDEKFGNSLDSTMANIQGATKGLNENMEAAKNNILLRGYFKKKKKAAAKAQKIIQNKTDSLKKADIRLNKN